MATETATDVSMQDIAKRVEGALFTEADDETLDQIDDDEVLEDDDLEDDDLPEDDDPDSEDEEEGDDLDDIADGELTLAALLGIDDERIVEGEDGNFMFNAIVDGETKQVPLSDLVSNFQLQSHVNNKSIALENERKEFEEVRTKVTDELKTRVQGITALGEYMEKSLVAEYSEIDWNQLRQDNPTEWAALRQEFAERAQQIQQVQASISEESDRINEQQQKELKEKFDEYQKEQLRLLIVDNPDWADEQKRSAGLSEIRTFLASTYGFTDDEMKAIGDHRLVKVFKDAKAFREGKKAAETKRTKKKLPKFQKPGASGNTKSLAKARAVKAKRDAVKKTGNVNDVANLLVDRM